MGRRLTAVPSTQADEPPAALEAEYRAAARVIEDLAAQQVNLHFEVDERSNRVRVQVLDGSGAVIREIPARSLLDMLSGGGLMIDTHG
jgi:uncharacterized FlaG/YvyC family protein